MDPLGEFLYVSDENAYGQVGRVYVVDIRPGLDSYNTRSPT
jgi:hypothetical protein